MAQVPPGAGTRHVIGAVERHPRWRSQGVCLWHGAAGILDAGRAPGDDAYAYVNACPHVWLPLTYRSGSVVSADGGRLVCSNHYAEFSVEDGSALSGPVTPGCGLTPVPVHVDAHGSLIIGD